MAFPVLHTRTARPLRTSTPTWSPLRELDELQRLLAGAANDRTPAWSPAADVRETDEAYTVEIELPGVKREDIAVDLTEGTLAVSGEIAEREGHFRRRTRRTGQFRYAVTLPEGVDPDQVSAELAEGVLTVQVPKRPEDATRRIEIK
ncbi:MULTISPECIES: Hsp20/alpha crystallin family protein [Prauserella salsuginis group]|nr:MULTISPECIES: Hsp20/alpha crystallin family protein [Prauserella salsuginis group]MCR3721627.1 heat shock protein Hsp20 [Prauserella flava]MCR3734319.1 heat shock protein Hsp20 [Prauserella salsuginis]